MAIGLLLSIAGGLGVAVGASDRVVGAMGVVVLFLATALVAPVVALWRQWQAMGRERGR
jgi:hypothetical protein